jgi:hypothetical protein
MGRKHYNLYLTDIVGRRRLHCTGSKEGLIAGFCEYGNEPLGSITTGELAITSCTHFWCLPLSATYPGSCDDNICCRTRSMKLLIMQFSPFTGHDSLQHPVLKYREPMLFPCLTPMGVSRIPPKCWGGAAEELLTHLRLSRWILFELNSLEYPVYKSKTKR